MHAEIYWADVYVIMQEFDWLAPVSMVTNNNTTWCERWRSYPQSGHIDTLLTWLCWLYNTHSMCLHYYHKMIPTLTDWISRLTFMQKALACFKHVRTSRVGNKSMFQWILGSNSGIYSATCLEWVDNHSWCQEKNGLSIQIGCLSRQVQFVWNPMVDRTCHKLGNGLSRGGRSMWSFNIGSTP